MWIGGPLTRQRSRERNPTVGKIAMHHGPLVSSIEKIVHVHDGAFGCAPLSENKQHWDDRDDIATEEPLHFPKEECPQTITGSWHVQM